MTRSRVVWSIALFIAVSAQSAAVLMTSLIRRGFQGASWLAVAVAVSFGILCGIGLIRDQDWCATLFLWWCAVWSAIGVLNGLSAWWLLVSLCAALVIWDLARFEKRIDVLVNRQLALQLEKDHLLKLGIVLIAGLGLALLALFIRVQLNFTLELLLVIALLLGLGQLVRSLR